MYRSPTSLVTIDIYDNVIRLLAELTPYISCEKGSNSHQEVIKKICLMTKDILDDIITENLYWTKDGTVAISERYIHNFKVKNGCSGEVLDIIDNYIVLHEAALDKLHILPSWAFFEVTLRSSYVTIYIHGDYRIEDWMKKYGKKIKTCRLPRVK